MLRLGFARSLLVLEASQLSNPNRDDASHWPRRLFDKSVKLIDTNLDSTRGIFHHFGGLKEHREGFGF